MKYRKASGKSTTDTVHSSTALPTVKRSFFNSLIFFNCCHYNESNNYNDNNNNADLLTATHNMQIPATNMSLNEIIQAKEFSFCDTPVNDKNCKNVGQQQLQCANDKIFMCNGKSYPKNQLFILGEASQKILAKITQVNLSSPGIKLTPLKEPNISPPREKLFSRGKSNSIINLDKDNIKKSPNVNEKVDPYDNPKYKIFSLYDKGIKVDDWSEITPEIIAEHVAKRLKCPFIIDALCGVGGNIIQFAKYSQFVLGIDIDPVKTSYAQHNAEVYNVSSKVDFFTGDFLKIRNLNANVVHIAPSLLKSQEQFSIFKHLVPNMIDVTGKALEISYSLAFKLPKCIDFKELPLLFNKSFEKHETYSKRFCIEIEIIYIDNEIDCYMIYFGDCSSIMPDEEYEKIYEFISDNELDGWNKKFLLETIKKILEKVGLNKSLKYLFSLSDLLCINGSYNDSLFDSFIQLISNENILTREDISRLNCIEHNKISQYNIPSSLLIQPGSYANNKPLNGNNLGSPHKPLFTNQQSYQQNSLNPQHSLNLQHALNPRQRHDQNQSQKLKLNSQCLQSIDSNMDKIPELNSNKFAHDKIPSSEYINDFESPKHAANISSSGINSHFNNGLYNHKESPFKSHFDYNNDMVISSYSVDSGFFKESHSDEILSFQQLNHDVLLPEDNNPSANKSKHDPNDDSYHLTYYEAINYGKKDKKTKDPKEFRGNRDPKDLRDGRDTLDPKDYRDSKASKEPKDYKNLKELKEPKDLKELKELRNALKKKPKSDDLLHLKLISNIETSNQITPDRMATPTENDNNGKKPKGLLTDLLDIKDYSSDYNGPGLKPIALGGIYNNEPIWPEHVNHSQD